MIVDHSYRDFLNDCGRHPLLTSEQELLFSRKVQLALPLEQKLREGKRLTPNQERVLKQGRRAKDRMINSNLRLVVVIAKRYASRTRHMTVLDLIQEGVIGLNRAVEKFDPQRGYKFSTYAYWWIRQGMTRAVLQQDPAIRMPHNIAEKASRMKTTANRLAQELRRTPTHEELAEALGVEVEELGMMMERSSALMSLDASINDDGSTLAEVVADPRSTTEADFQIDDYLKLECVLGRLDERERFIVESRHEMNGNKFMSFAELAKHFDVSKHRVQELERRAMRKLQMGIRYVHPLGDSKTGADLSRHLDKGVQLLRISSGAQKHKHLQLANAPHGAFK